MSAITDAFADEMRQAGLQRVAEELKPLVKPAIRFRSGFPGGAVPIGATKFGGLPDLPGDVEWPRYGGRPQSFLAQINLGALPVEEVVAGDAPGMPAAGTLSFFWDSMQEAFGLEATDRGGFRVVYTTPNAELVRRQAPEGMLGQGLFKEVAWEPVAEWSVPTSRVLSRFNEEEYARFEPLVDRGPHHLLLGYAHPVQTEPSYLAATIAAGGSYLRYPDDLEELAAQWRNLLQIDSDDVADAMWGDAGSLYFSIRDADLRTMDVEGCWFEMQSA